MQTMLMKHMKRQRHPRYLVRVPVSFRRLDSPEMPEQVAESLNLSRRGVCFATSFPLEVGSSIQLFLKLPEQITGMTSNEWCCRGRVIHTQPVESNPGMMIVGVLIVYYEIAKTAEQRAS